MLCPTHLKCADTHALERHHETRTARNKRQPSRHMDNARNNPKNSAKRKAALLKRNAFELQVFESVFMYYKVKLFSYVDQ